MKKKYIQSLCLQLTYKGVFQWFLKLFVGMNLGDSKFLKTESQFIILANHSSHLDALSIMASLPANILWKVKPVAAEDYFGNTKTKAALSNYFINTLLIRRKPSRDGENDPITKMLDAIDAGYSLILFPEGTRATTDQMDKIKPGIAKILSLRPHIKYVPVFLTGMGSSLPKGGSMVLPYKSSINYGKPTLPINNMVKDILNQISTDFKEMQQLYQPPIEDNEDDT